MKKTFLIITILVLLGHTYAQSKMTDREFAGLKGQVKSVLNESSTFEIVDGKIEADPRQKVSEDVYDAAGNITRKIYDEGVLGDGFSIVSGVKTQKSLYGATNNKPIKYKYVYDQQGKTIEERKYNSGGVLFFKSVYKYNEKGQINRETWYAKDKLTSDNLYTYDAQGNLTEIKYQILKTTHQFKDYKFDAQGNWIERTQTVISELDGKQYLESTFYYRKIQYF